MNTNQSEYDIILVNPGTALGDRRLAANVGLASIEAFLRLQGIRCKAVHIWEIDEYVEQSDVFGISVMDHTYIPAKTLTQRLQHKTIIWGGWTATALPEYVLRENPGVDYVILQEGEQRLLHLLQSFQQPEQFDQLDGIAYRDEHGKITIRPPRTFLNLDDLPIPTDLALLGEVVFVELARGCYGRCGYCQETHRMRFKSAHKAAAEIEHWHAQGYRYFYLGDANSIAHGKLLGELVREIEARQLEIQVFLSGRPSDVLRNHAALQALFASPFIHPYSVEVGVEANTQHALELLGRRGTPETNRHAIRALLDLQRQYSPLTRINANMILFSHFDMTLEDFVENVRFIGEFECSRDVLALHLYGIANTPIWFAMQARGFPMQTEQGLRIVDYPFTDPVIDRLFKKLVQTPLQIKRQQKENFSFYDHAEFQHQCHDKLLEFYHSPDIRESMLNFLNS